MSRSGLSSSCATTLVESGPGWQSTATSSQSFGRQLPGLVVSPSTSRSSLLLASALSIVCCALIVRFWIRAVLATLAMAGLVGAGTCYVYSRYQRAEVDRARDLIEFNKEYCMKFDEVH